MAYERIDDASHPDYKPPMKRRKKPTKRGKGRRKSPWGRQQSRQRSIGRSTPGYSNDYMRGVIDGMMKGGR